MSRSSSALKLSEAAPLFAALGDETRLRLVTRLGSEGPLSIVRLSEGIEMSRQAVTKHLRALADAGLVHDDRRGRERIWALAPARLQLARASLDRISAQWDAALERLQAHLEQNP